MRRPAVIKIFSALINILVTFIAVIIILYFQDWFGSGDTFSHIYWTIPLATGLAVSGRAILSLFRIKNRLIRLFLTFLTAGLISYGFVILVYMFSWPWFYTYSFSPFYPRIAGSVGQLLFIDLLLPQTKAKLKPIKTILVIVAFPLTVVATIAVINTIYSTVKYFTRPKPETFLIPKDFEGIARIVYGEDCGINPPNENSRRILEIPSNGLLIIQPQYEAGRMDHEYYYVDQKGNREKLNFIIDDKNKSKGVYHLLTGMLGSSHDSSEITFTDLYVYNDDFKELTDRESELRMRQKNSLTMELVNDCRKIKK